MMSRLIGIAAALLSAAMTPTVTMSAETSAPPHIVSRAAPGTIFRIWPLEGGVRPGYKGYRILYRSTGLGGAPVAVFGQRRRPASAEN
jgi:hypothetical protein